METRTCANDASHTETRAIPKLSHVHDLTATAAKAATCEEAGNIAYWTCSGCGKVFSDAEGTTEIEQSATVTQPTGHDWGEWTVTTPATEDADGVETRTCANDASHQETRAISKLTQEAVTTFTVVWLNGDGSQLDSKTYTEGQTEPTTDKTPIKAEDDSYTYSFSKWTLDKTEGNTRTYKPEFTATAKTVYTVIWRNGDGTELDRKTYAEGQQEPTTDKTPTKESDAQNTYTFSKWDNGVTDGNVKTYTPEFTATAKTVYTVIWLNGDGSQLDSKTYTEGQNEPTTDKVPVKESDVENVYTFSKSTSRPIRRSSPPRRKLSTRSSGSTATAVSLTARPTRKASGNPRPTRRPSRPPTPRTLTRSPGGTTA